jgi:hypothetical protein
MSIECFFEVSDVALQALEPHASERLLNKLNDQNANLQRVRFDQFSFCACSYSYLPVPKGRRLAKNPFTVVCSN